MEEGLSQREFSFGGHTLTVGCRQPPEAKAQLTLTWQIGGDGKEAAEAQHDGAAPDFIGLDIWPAAIALSRYLATHPSLVAGQAVVELGAGVGLVGLLAAKLGAASVLLTDYEPRVLEAAASNAATNGVAELCPTLRLDWRNLEATLPPALRGTCRLALAADVLYASLIAQPLADTLAALLHRQDGVVLLGHQVRRAVVLDRQTKLPKLEEQDEPLEKFKAACRSAGLTVRTLSSRQTCSNVDTDPMLLIAIGWEASRLDALPTS